MRERKQARTARVQEVTEQGREEGRREERSKRRDGKRGGERRCFQGSYGTLGYALAAINTSDH